MSEQELKARSMPASDERQVVVFHLSEEEFGLEIDRVREIVRVPDMTPIPRAPDYIAGICNLRGNILPIIDTRVRFSIDAGEATDHTRLLVVENKGILSGLIVDSVREVMRLNYTHVEPPPAVCRGIDREFLNGVVKVEDGRRLILILNLDEVIFSKAQSGKGTEAQSFKGTGAEKIISEEKISEEHLVSFRVAEDEYAFDISKVREIIKITDITAIPNVPGYVKGLFTIRNQLMPIIDLREILGVSSLVSERHAMIDKAVEEHRALTDRLRHTLNAETHFVGTLNAKETTFGKWLENYNTSGSEVEHVVRRLKRARAEFFGYAASALAAEDKSLKTTLFDNVLSLLPIITDILSEFKDVMTRHILEEQRALVIQSGSITIAYLVDGVDEVIRIPKNVIDETPTMARSARKEVKEVAKMDQGKRLIMIMDESALISSESSQIVSQAAVKADENNIGKTLVQQSMTEDQVVTFNINTEEYAIRIMQVQEINRIKDITAVPRAPVFIDGMTNLRGNVIPVLNIRRLFGLEDRDADDQTRIIIADIDGNKTGIRVDKVNEVLRLPRQDIIQTPDIVTSESNRYMRGICRISDGKRLVVLLDIEKILGKEELNHLAQMMNYPEPRKTVAAEKPKKNGKKKKA